MSTSLESLVRQSMAEPERRETVGGLPSFLLIGACAALGYVATSSLVAGLPLGLPRWAVSALCYGAFIAPVYLLHRRYSFKSDAPHESAFPRYLAVQIAGLGIAAVFSYLAYGVLGLPNLPAAMLVIALTSGLNFLVLRHWAFARRRQ